MVKISLKGKDAQPAEQKKGIEGKPEQKAVGLPLGGEKGGVSKFGIGIVDTALMGGIPGGSCVLLAGGSGVGKTILAMQWLFNGYRTYQEPGIYITFEERKDKLYEDMLGFGWDLAKYEKAGMFVFLEYTPEQVKKVLVEGGGTVDAIIEKMNAKRMVIRHGR